MIIEKLKYLILFFAFAFALSACERYEATDVDLFHTDSWDVEFSLASGNCVVYNDTLYVLFGRGEEGSAEVPSTKFRYAAMKDLENFIEGDLPIKPRVNATTILVGDKLFMGLGFRGRVYSGVSLLRDWWVYDFSTKQLIRLSDFPTNDVIAPVVWFDNNYIYTLFGYNSNFSKSVYRYDMYEDRWELYSETSDPWLRADALGVRIGDSIYFGGGCAAEMRNDWWRYDWVGNEWYKCSSMPYNGRIFASSVAVGDNVYVLGGRYFGGTETREHFYETIISYDTKSDNWSIVGRMEQAVENMIAWEYEGDLYWGLGQKQDGSFVKKIYRREMK